MGKLLDARGNKIGEKHHGRLIDTQGKWMYSEDLFPKPKNIKELLPHEKKIRRLTDQVEAGETAFGTHFKPLIDQLTALPEDRQKESIETFKLIHPYVKGTDFSELELCKADLLFLLTTKTGNLLRRPVLHHVFAAKVDKEVKATTPEEQRVKDILLPVFRGSSWSQFVKSPFFQQYVKKELSDDLIYMNIEESSNSYHSAMRQAVARSEMTTTDLLNQMQSVGNTFMDVNSNLIVDEFHAEERTPYHDRSVRFYSDAWHPFNQEMDVNAIMSALQVEKMRQNKGVENFLPPLMREQSLMIVEDNPIHRMFFEGAKHVKNLKGYAPHENTKPEEGKSHRGVFEKYGEYPSAERALEVIEGNVREGGKPPDLLMTDIELAGKKNGIELIRDVHRRWPKTVICMMYSSNVPFYQNDIDALKKDGLIIEHWHKQDFTLGSMIRRINKELEKESPGLATFPTSPSSQSHQEKRKD